MTSADMEAQYSHQRLRQRVIAALWIAIEHFFGEFRLLEKGDGSLVRRLPLRGRRQQRHEILAVSSSRHEHRWDFLLNGETGAIQKTCFVRTVSQKIFGGTSLSGSSVPTPWMFLVLKEGPALFPIAKDHLIPFTELFAQKGDGIKYLRYWYEPANIVLDCGTSTLRAECNPLVQFQ
jgi:hypothetical protein